LHPTAVSSSSASDSQFWSSALAGDGLWVAESISGATAPDDLVIESGPGAFHHVHYLRIPEAALTAPPLEGVKVTSSKALFHQHPVALSQKELTEIHNGGTVSQRASSHVFVIALARGLPVSRPFSP
jgi:hypothetical protein